MDAQVSPAFSFYSQPPRYKRGNMRERQVNVANADGTTTVHRFWTDVNVNEHMAWPEDDGLDVV